MISAQMLMVLRLRRRLFKSLSAAQSINIEFKLNDVITSDPPRISLSRKYARILIAVAEEVADWMKVGRNTSSMFCAG